MGAGRFHAGRPRAEMMSSSVGNDRIAASARDVAPNTSSQCAGAIRSPPRPAESTARNCDAAQSPSAADTARLPSPSARSPTMIACAANATVHAVRAIGPLPGVRSTASSSTTSAAADVAVTACTGELWPGQRATHVSIDADACCGSDRGHEGTQEDGEDDSSNGILAGGCLQQGDDTRRLRAQSTRHGQERKRAAEDELDLQTRQDRVARRRVDVPRVLRSRHRVRASGDVCARTHEKRRNPKCISPIQIGYERRACWTSSDRKSASMSAASRCAGQQGRTSANRTSGRSKAAKWPHDSSSLYCDDQRPQR